jgi:hypothetical protein
VLKNIPKKDKTEVAYMLKDALEDERKMQELAVMMHTVEMNPMHSIFVMIFSNLHPRPKIL